MLLGGLTYGLLKTNISSGNTNFDALTDFGIYAHPAITGSSVSNGMGILIVFGYNSNPYRGIQVDITQLGIAIRTKMGSDSWSNWIELASA